MDDLKQFTIESPLPPLWMMYPEIHRYSIGWRMGYGEGYKDRFYDWFDTLSSKERMQYQQLFPAPVFWGRYYDMFENEDTVEEDSELTYAYQDYCIEFWRKKGVPKYSLEGIQSRYKQGEVLKYSFFWGHQPAKDGSLTQSCLSQWWMAEFRDFIYCNTYCCMEQYMMAEKARLFGDEDILQQILACKSPKAIKALGRKVRNFASSVWDDVKHSIILTGSWNKFTQDDSLRKFFSETKDVLVEASPYDSIWGIKMAADNIDSKNPCKWKGQNMLGFALMEVRDEIQMVYKNYDMIDWKKVKGFENE